MLDPPERHREELPGDDSPMFGRIPLADGNGFRLVSNMWAGRMEGSSDQCACNF